ncbi:MAG TPA: 4-alpha-glucanotransferase [Chthoniobacteraceae bacterium]|nr:4-alpha-glucanotransferase [Chthoniobacteraceae bacterium]
MNLSPEHRIAGILAPLFALRTKQDLGVGDLAGLRELVEWAAETGFKLVQLLPINETGADNSPYMAVSSAAIEPSTLEITPDRVPGLTPEAFAETLTGVDVAKLRKGPVSYSQVKPLKLGLLRRAFENFSASDLARNTRRAKAFRQWVAAQAGWIEAYGLFRVLMDENGVNEQWDLWPENQRTHAAAQAWLEAQPAAVRKRIWKEARFYQWVQWVAFHQWEEAKLHAGQHGVALMGDVPFGVSYYSADVFAEPDLFDLQWSGGAPPEPAFVSDPFVVKWGQNWGVPLYQWARHRETGFRWWRQRVRLTRGMFHLFRIDHVLGFYRIYAFPWRPQENPHFANLSNEEARARAGGRLPRFFAHDDETEQHRALNRREGEEYLRALLEETGEHRLIGEDLGTVPPYVRPSLTSLGIAGFKIPIWEPKWDGWLIDGADYQRLSLATYATHDHEPLRARWDRLYHDTQAGKEPAAAAAWDQMVKLTAFAHLHMQNPQPWSDDLHRSLLLALFRSNSWIAVCMITDLFGATQRFNVPGAIAESNWSERLPCEVGKWRKRPELKALAGAIKELLKQTGR